MPCSCGPRAALHARRALAGDALARRWKLGDVYPLQEHKRVHRDTRGSSYAHMQTAGPGFCTSISCGSVTANPGHTCAVQEGLGKALVPGEDSWAGPEWPLELL